MRHGETERKSVLLQTGELRLSPDAQEVHYENLCYPEWRKQSLDIQKSLWEAIDTVKKAQLNNIERLEVLTREIGQSEATTCRYRILRFNDEILHEQRHTKEHFDQILDDITRYEKYCDEHPEYENNKATLAIKNVKRVYQKCSDENSFL